ncbi:MAG: SMC family ATPase [Deltaproteobacteria bacterium]|nr:MAG: SMC family ATPase [Deltaproteobacteria bacterium]
MQILSIQMKNIKSHRDKEFSFAPGINVLSGPNGIGKSTVFEAVGYALFGVDARDFVGNIDRFVTIGEKKGEVKVVFQPGDDETYQASRTVGSNSKWLLARKIGEDFEVEDHANAEETQNRIKELLGLDNGRSLADQFKLVIGPFQNDFLGPFVIKQPTKRQEAFDEILGIDAWRKTYKGSKSLLDAVTHKIELIAAEVEAKQEQLEVLPDKKQELKDVKVARKGHGEKLKSEQSAHDKISAQLQQFEKQKEALDKVRGSLEKTRDRITTGKEHIGSQSTLVNQAEEAIKLLEKHRPGKEAFDKAEALLKQLREREQQRRAIQQDVETLGREALRLTESFDHETKEISQTQLDLSNEKQKLDQERQRIEPESRDIADAAKLEPLRTQLEEAQSARNMLDGSRSSLLEGRDKLAEGVCPFFQEPCQNIAGKEPRDAFTARFAAIDEQSKQHDQKIADLRIAVNAAEQAQKKLDELKIRSASLDRQIETFELRRKKLVERSEELKKLTAAKIEAEAKSAARKKNLDAFAKLDVEIKQAEQQRLDHQKDRDEYNRNQQAAEDLPNRRKLLEKYQTRMESLEKDQQAQSAEEQRLAQSYSAEQHQLLKQQQDTLQDSIATLKEQLNTFERDQKRLEGEIERLKKIKEEIDKRLAEKKAFEEKETLVKFLRNRVFKSVSKQLSERFREEISQRAHSIYRVIAEIDEELYWGENYQIVLRDMVDGEIRERTDDQLSGGQTMSAVVALRLALLQTIGARIAFFDEPTSNLDATRRENLAHAFRAIDVGKEEVTEHWYDQLFLISHDVAFTEVTDQILTLE